MNYTPVATSGDWKTYTIPLSDFQTKNLGYQSEMIDCKDVTSAAFVTDGPTGGAAYIDNVYFNY